MKISKELRLNFGVGVALFALQLIAIWWLQPSPEDFVPGRTITGIYQFDGGVVRLGAHRPELLMLNCFVR